MLECPLATPFETQWFTADNDRYMRRMLLAAFLSIFFHLGIVASFWLYHYVQPQTINISSGTPDLPLRAQLVTIDSRAQSVAETPKPKPVKIEEVVTTENKSALQIPVKDKPKKVESVARKPTEVKETTKKTQGNAPQNSIASAKDVSKTIGIHNSLPVYAQPRYRSPPQSPEYPMQARRRGQQGNVVLYVLVEPNGRTSEVSVKQSSGYALLDKAAERAVAKWQIIPYELNGVPQRAFYQVLVKFELQK